jgi:tetratricopeptide (TPR) repeat protein
MNETSKASVRRSREPIFRDQYFVGFGIDIGAGDDSLGKQITRFPLIRSVRNWDLSDGDAQYLEGVADETFDFVYSSHSLEHMQDPIMALKNWLRVLKPGGYLIVCIPDEDMYEQGVWPSRFNLDHKWSFTANKAYPELPNSINVVDLIKQFSYDSQCERICKIREGYQEGLLGEDQTLGIAECAIEFVLRKQKPRLSSALQSGLCYEQNASEELAVDCYARVIREAPQSFDAYNLLANLLARLGRTAETMNVWNLCVNNIPNSHTARLFRALFLISMGKFDEGFNLRDELVSDERRTPTELPAGYPKWQGESLRGKSVVIWTEFGYGDEIMFARFGAIMKRHYQAKKVSIVCQAPLVRLFKTVLGVDDVFSDEQVADIPAHDFWVFPHSIPVHYSLEKFGVPNEVPYLRLQKDATSKAATLLPKKLKGRMRVGIVYRGNPTHENDALRSIHNLKVLQDLFEIPGIDWVNLQKKVETNELPKSDLKDIKLPENISILHLGDDLGDFLETATICSQLDLLISVDTSVAHLAGALNIPTVLMLPTFADWRWGVDQVNSVWYPSITIYRQKLAGDWHGVVVEIRTLLCKKLRQGFQ